MSQPRPIFYSAAVANLRASIASLYNATIDTVTARSGAFSNLTVNGVDMSSLALQGGGENVAGCNVTASNASFSNINVNQLSAYTSYSSNLTVYQVATLAVARATILNGNTTSFSNLTVSQSANIKSLTNSNASFSNIVAQQISVSNATIPEVANIATANINSNNSSNLRVQSIATIATARVSDLFGNTTSLSNLTVPQTATITTLTASNIGVSNLRALSGSLSNVTVSQVATLGTANINILNSSNANISGNVGIGTNNPTTQLDVAGTAKVNTLTVSGTASVGGNLSITSGSLFQNGVQLTSGSSVLATALPTSGVTAGTYGDATSVPVLTVDSYGRVTSASTALYSAANLTGTLNAALLPASGVTAGIYGSATTVPVITVDAYGRVTDVSTSAVDVGVSSASPTFSGIVSVNSTATAGGMVQLANTNNGECSMAFKTNGTECILGLGSSGGTTNTFSVGACMYINTATSMMGIGTTTPSYKLHVIGNIFATGTVTSASDIRNKTNLVKITDALDKVSQISGYTYNTINSNADDVPDTRNCGLIAQEVEHILPEVVHSDADGNKSVAYGNTVALLVEAIKELQTQIREIKDHLQMP